MKTSLKFKTAAVAIVATAFAVSTPAHAQYNSYGHASQSNNNGNQILGAGIGAVAGGVLGSQLAASGARTEGSVLGAVLGGVAGAAIAGNGSSNNHGYNNGYYNTQTGYYPASGYSHSGYTQGGYYQQPRVTYGYQQPVYPQRTYHTTTYVQTPRYYSQPRYVSPYYGRTGTNLSINIGGGSLFGRNGYSNRYYTAPVRYRNNRRNVRRNDGRRGYHK